MRRTEVWCADEDAQDELIQDAINGDEPLSNCCGAPFLENTDLCQQCKEHAMAEIVDFQFPEYKGVKPRAQGFPGLDVHCGEKEPAFFTITYDPIDRGLIDFSQQLFQIGS